MVSNQRVEDLIAYCEGLKNSVIQAEARRDELIQWKNDGMSVTTSDSAEDLFPTLIEEANKAIEIYKNILIKIEALRDRALNGEDV